MTLIAPLNIEYLLVNTFSGTITIFVAIALLFVGIMAAKFRMPVVVLGMCVALLSVLIMPLAIWLYATSVIIIGLLVGYTFTRIVKS